MAQRHRILLALAALPIIALLPASGAQPERGRALYELRCTGCHADSVHSRAKRVAADFGAVRGWVERWGRDLKLGWTAEEIDDVAVYLNDTYYRYPCPPTVCKVISRANPAASGIPSSS
jgi:hypothetical protein